MLTTIYWLSGLNRIQIDYVKNEERTIKSNTIYDLNGRRVDTKGRSKGIRIVDGKKYVID